jgi:hypothetical protein
MDFDAFSRLGRFVGVARTRRAALRAFLGAAALLPPSAAGARGKRKRQGTSRAVPRATSTEAARVPAAGKPVVIGPETDAGLAEGIIDCGDFLVDDRYEVTFTLRLYFDKAGNRVKGVEQVSGTDVFINAASGKEIPTKFHNNVLIDYTSDPPLGANAGVIFKVTVPGAGAVFLDVGRIVTDRTGEIVAFEAEPHQFFDGDVAGLCAALA